MKKLFLLLFVAVFTSAAFGQMTTLWENSSVSGTLPAWFSTTNTERGFAYNPVSDQVYVVSRNGGTFVRVVNANTGSDVGTLDVTGISGGTFPLNDIGSTFDGQLYGANLAIGAAALVKIYRWTNDAAAPTVAFESDLGGVDNKRIGDKITVVGNVSDNTAQIWLCDATSNKIYVLGTADNGATFTAAQTIVLPAGTFGSSPAVYPVPGDTIFVINSNGKHAQGWSYGGFLVGEIPGSQLGTGSNAVIIYFANDVPYITSFQYGNTTENGRILMVGDNPANAVTYVVTPSMFQTSNANGVGDIDIRFNVDGTQTLYVLSTNNGFGAYTISYPPLVNGRFNEAYVNLAQKQNSNQGFGPAIDIFATYYHVDDVNLYIAVDSYLDTGTNNGIVLFVRSSNLDGTGVPAGTALGGVNNGGHLFGAGGNPNFRNDFETHLGFVINPGNSTTDVYVDAARYSGGTKEGQYIGNTNQEGTPVQGPAAAGIFAENAITYAYYGAHDFRRGWEISIPLSEIGNPSSSDLIEVFAAVVSSSAFFSDVTVPGNVIGGNPGFDPDFSTLGGGPYHSMGMPVPVELTFFSASVDMNNITLTWSTATETNNAGFEIERGSDTQSFVKVGQVNGYGTTSETKNYAFTDKNLAAGTYYYRLKQVDLDGSFEYSNTIEVNLTVNPNSFELSQNYPNPFNPATSIRFMTGKNEIATLRVFNVLGQEVATLFNGMTEAGKSYQISFDASQLTSGIYFYALTQGNNVSTKKMILIK